MEIIKLNNGVEIPQLGFGVYMSQAGDECENAVKWALEAGYRHIDTAKAYDNEESTGKGIKDSGVPREEIFLTTKLWNEDVRQRNARQACEDSLRRLGTDYLDLYLIHWPAEGYVEAWQEMEKLQDEGKCRAIGVSNFNWHHLEDLEKAGCRKPQVNQIESNPQFNNRELAEQCIANDIAVEAWSPLGGSTENPVLGLPELVAMAEKYGKSVAQMLIRWHLQRGNIVIPKSVHKERIFANFDVFDFELAEDDMEAIYALEKGLRTGPDPETFDF